MADTQRSVSPLLWPFYALWRLVTFVLSATGRLLCGVLGVALTLAGAILVLTVVGFPLGVPLVMLGVLLLVRALF